MFAYSISPCPRITSSLSPIMTSSDQPHTPHTPISTPDADPTGVIEASPDSPRLRPVSDDEVAKLRTTFGVIPKPEAERKPGEPRFPPKNIHGEKQCVYCAEVDTPRWRGSLCNACALWKRSRGTDRPLPLLFPVRKRPRSPSPVSNEEDEDDQAMHTAYGRSQPHIPSSSHSSPVYPHFPYNYPGVAQFPRPPPAACAMCNGQSELAIRDRPFCVPCARLLHAQAQAERSSSIPGPKSGEVLRVQTSAHSRQPSATMALYPGPPSSTAQLASATREKVLLSTPAHPKDMWTPVSSATRPRFWGEPPAAQNSQAVYQTHISPLRSEHGGLRDPRSSRLIPSPDMAFQGRSRSATVSGIGRLEELALPSATVHLHPSRRPSVDRPGLLLASPTHHESHAYSPVPSSGAIPTSASKRPRFQLSPSPPPQGVAIAPLLAQDAFRSTGARGTVSASPPRVEVKLEPSAARFVAMPSPLKMLDVDPRTAASPLGFPHRDMELPSHDEFMQKAEWIWGLLERTNRLLGEMDINEVP